MDSSLSTNRISRKEVHLYDLLPSNRQLVGCVRSVLWGLVEVVVQRHGVSASHDDCDEREVSTDSADEDLQLLARKQLLNDMLDIGMTNAPLQFGPAKQRSHSQSRTSSHRKDADTDTTNTENTHRRWDDPPQSPTKKDGVRVLPVPADEAKMAEWNVYLARYIGRRQREGQDGGSDVGTGSGAGEDRINGNSSSSGGHDSGGGSSGDDGGGDETLYPVRVLGNGPSCYLERGRHIGSGIIDNWNSSGSNSSGSSSNSSSGDDSSNETVIVEYLGYTEDTRCELPRNLLHPVPSHRPTKPPPVTQQHTKRPRQQYERQQRPMRIPSVRSDSGRWTAASRALVMPLLEYSLFCRPPPPSYTPPTSDNQTSSVGGHSCTGSTVEPVTSNDSDGDKYPAAAHESWHENAPQAVHEKYWDQRYRLFSKYDRGVSMDEESWYSVTPEIIAHHIAEKCGRALLPPPAHLQSKPHLPGRVNSGGGDNGRNDGRGNGEVYPPAVVWDLFCGCGGNALPLATIFPQVVAVDINPAKMEQVRVNGEIYGVGEKIQRVCGDAYEWLRSPSSPSLAPPDESEIVDSSSTTNPSSRSVPVTCSTPSDPSAFTAGPCVIILAPPWGGPAYTDTRHFDMHSGFPSGDGFDLVSLATQRCPHVVCIFPKNITRKQIRQLTTLVNLPCVVEDIFLHHKQKMTVLYYGHKFQTLSSSGTATPGTVGSVASTAADECT